MDFYKTCFKSPQKIYTKNNLKLIRQKTKEKNEENSIRNIQRQVWLYKISFFYDFLKETQILYKNTRHICLKDLYISLKYIHIYFLYKFFMLKYIFLFNKYSFFLIIIKDKS